RSFVELARRGTPPLKDGASARVWAKLESRPVRRIAWAMFAAGALCAGAAASLIASRLPRPLAPMHMTEGPRRGTLRVGGRLLTGEGRSLIELPGAARAVAGAHTMATIDRYNMSDVVVHLERGSLLLHVAPRVGRAPFVVRTPELDVRVVGTVLRVVVHDDG